MQTLKPHLRFSFNTLMSMDKNYARNEIVGTNTKAKNWVFIFEFHEKFLNGEDFANFLQFNPIEKVDQKRIDDLIGFDPINRE